MCPLNRKLSDIYLLVTEVWITEVIRFCDRRSERLSFYCKNLPINFACNWVFFLFLFCFVLFCFLMMNLVGSFSFHFCWISLKLVRIKFTKQDTNNFQKSMPIYFKCIASTCFKPFSRLIFFVPSSQSLTLILK